VTVEVFDTRGAHVATLIDAETDAGAYTVTWNGRDDRGITASSGVYFGRLTSSAGTRSYKMTLLK
jgi:flagellar hook assembly protein FlgD